MRNVNGMNRGMGVELARLAWEGNWKKHVEKLRTKGCILEGRLRVWWVKTGNRGKRKLGGR